MPECTADATWYGSLTDGEGDVTLGDDGWSGRYATPDVPDATNPEELLAAAHSSCYAMTTAYVLETNGFEVTDVTTEAVVSLDVEGGFDVTAVELTVTGDVPDATDEEFREAAAQAEAACPVSKALAGTEIDVVEATLARD